MRSKAAWLTALLLVVQPLVAQYRMAMPGYRFEFPRDYFDHPDFQTEWWYYTGNVKSGNGHRFGFELTFFREAVERGSAQTNPWGVADIFLAHLALSDLDAGKFYHAERTNRRGPGIAGVSQSEGRIWDGNWDVKWRADKQTLQAVDERFQLHFTLHSEKAPVFHGENGVSQKADGPGRASHYISLTRLETNGTIELNGEQLQVAGISWMDHEFFTHQLADDQIGWDWLSLQLDDRTELMLFHLRRKDGSIDSFSAGTYIDANGRTTHLRKTDFALEPAQDTWTSPVTHAVYPIRWNIAVPKLDLQLEATTPLRSQEMTSNSTVAPSYWEGAITLAGRRGYTAMSGVGYLEMTGYDRPVRSVP